MIFSAVVVISIFSLLSSARAATIHARQDGCTFVCPDKDPDSNDLYSSSIDDALISCSYFGEPLNLCTYDLVSRISLPRSELGFTLRSRQVGNWWGMEIAPMLRLNNASHVEAGSLRKRWFVEGLLINPRIQPTDGNITAPRVHAPSAMYPLPHRIGLRTPHLHPGAHIHPSPSPATRPQLRNHANSGVPSRILRRTR